MAVFVLVHGSWHDGAAWEGVIRNLEAQGQKAFAPTAIGYEKGANKKVTHAQCVKSIVNFVNAKSLSDFALVGHSFGGTFISKVAEVIPEKIRLLVIQNGFVVRDGHSVLDESPPASPALFEKMAGESADNSFLLPFPVWREAFISGGDLKTAMRTYALLSPERLQPAKDKLDLKKFYSLDIPKSYINCTEDIALPPGEWGGIRGCRTDWASTAWCRCPGAVK